MAFELRLVIITKATQTRLVILGQRSLIHRIDIYHSDDNERHLEWEGVGLFLIEDGLIREWQDFTMRIQRGKA